MIKMAGEFATHYRDYSFDDFCKAKTDIAAGEFFEGTIEDEALRTDIVNLYEHLKNGIAILE